MRRWMRRKIEGSEGRTGGAERSIVEHFFKSRHTHTHTGLTCSPLHQPRGMHGPRDRKHKPVCWHRALHTSCCDGALLPHTDTHTHVLAVTPSRGQKRGTHIWTCWMETPWVSCQGKANGNGLQHRWSNPGEQEGS